MGEVGQALKPLACAADAGLYQPPHPGDDGDHVATVMKRSRFCGELALVIQGWSASHACSSCCTNLYPVGTGSLTKVPHASARGRGLQGRWDPSPRRVSASRATVSIHLGIG